MSDGISDREGHLIALKIIQQLHGLNVAQAKWVLREAEQILAQHTSVDATGEAFAAAFQALEAGAGE